MPEDIHGLKKDQLDTAKRILGLDLGDPLDEKITITILEELQERRAGLFDGILHLFRQRDPVIAKLLNEDGAGLKVASLPERAFALSKLILDIGVGAQIVNLRLALRKSKSGQEKLG